VTNDFDNVKCECEHISHTDRTNTTPNGNPGHKYGTPFKRRFTSTISTILGPFTVCHDCVDDCFGGELGAVWRRS